MKKKKMRSDKDIPLRKEDLVWHSLDDLHVEWMKNKKYRDAYEEARRRRRIATQIRESRIAKRLTQKTVAQRADMPQSVIARIESGRHDASLPTITKIASALGKKVEVQLV